MEEILCTAHHVFSHLIEKVNPDCLGSPRSFYRKYFGNLIILGYGNEVGNVHVEKMPVFFFSFSWSNLTCR